VVERGPEKAGVGGSIPSLATILAKSSCIQSPVLSNNCFRSLVREGVVGLSLSGSHVSGVALWGRCFLCVKQGNGYAYLGVQSFRECQFKFSLFGPRAGLSSLILSEARGLRGTLP
jgi:hypothetical protein